MAKSDKQVEQAITKAAEALLSRPLLPHEVADLVRRMQRADGTFRQRANEALRGLTGLTDAQIKIRAATSDNTDRVITDMQNVLDEWVPGT
jgi:hypothetical protein